MVYGCMKNLLLTASICLLAACTAAQSTESSQDQAKTTQTKTSVAQAAPATGPQALFASERQDGLAELIVAGGCFWCIESDFEKIKGVKEAIAGYSGGGLDNGDYKTVSYKETGHYEVIKVIYDPKIVTYRKLIDKFWTKIDPTDPHGQFCDKGSSYRTAIFATPEQMADAQASKDYIVANKPFSADIVTPILPAVTFYKAEEYHQDYYKKNPAHYQRYRRGCRRDARTQALWGK